MMNLNLVGKKYSSLMATLAKDKVNELIAAKKEVEEMLKQVMVRTERYVPNLAVYQDVKVKPTTEEVVEYKKIREVLTKAAKELNRTAPSLNIDYVKSSPYLFSFIPIY